MVLGLKFGLQTKRAAVSAGKGFFGTLAATYVTGQVSLQASLVGAAVLAGLSFFTQEEQSSPPPAATPPGDSAAPGA